MTNGLVCSWVLLSVVSHGFVCLCAANIQRLFDSTMHPIKKLCPDYPKTVGAYVSGGDGQNGNSVSSSAGGAL
jgi:hypothetical protein